MAGSRSVRAAAAVLALALALAGCASSAMRGADAAWRHGEVSAAADAYRRALDGDLSPAERERALLRLAVARLAPLSGPPEPELARELLDELLGSAGSGEPRPEARALLSLLDEAAGAAARLAALEQERSRLEAELDRARTEASVRDATLARLRANLDEARAELERSRRAFEDLKRIDLERHP